MSHIMAVDIVPSLLLLPAEILLEVARYGDVPEWKALSLTHSSTRAIGVELLYRSISFRYDVIGTLRGAVRLKLLLRTLSESPILATLVKDLLFQTRPWSHPKQKIPGSITDQLKLFLEILRLTQKITHLTIQGMASSAMWPSLEGLDLFSYSQLRSLVIDGDAPSDCWFLPCNMESLHIGALWRASKPCSAWHIRNFAVKRVSWTCGHYAYMHNEDALRLYGSNAQSGATPHLERFPHIETLRLQLRTHHRKDNMLTPSLGYNCVEAWQPQIFGSFNVLLGKTNISDLTAAKVQHLEVVLEDLNNEDMLGSMRPLHNSTPCCEAPLLRFHSLTSLEIPQQALFEPDSPLSRAIDHLPFSLETIVINHADIDIEAWLTDLAEGHHSSHKLRDIKVNFRYGAPKRFPANPSIIFKELGPKLNAVSISLHVSFLWWVSIYPSSGVAIHREQERIRPIGLDCEMIA